MREGFEPGDAIDKEQMRAIIQDVIDGTYALFDVETMANYDADFRGEEPLFISILAKQEGHNFGYIIFHDFLRRVGVKKTFLSTDFTEVGSNLFEKAVRDGLIEKISKPFGLQRLTRWRVIGDPVKNLEKIRDQK